VPYIRHEYRGTGDVAPLIPHVGTKMETSWPLQHKIFTFLLYETHAQYEHPVPHAAIRWLRTENFVLTFQRSFPATVALLQDRSELVHNYKTLAGCQILLCSQILPLNKRTETPRSKVKIKPGHH